MANAAISTLLNLVVLAGLPFLVYFTYHKRKHGRRIGEIARRAGLQPSSLRYIGSSLVVACIFVAALLLWPPPLEPFLRQGSPQRELLGLGVSAQSLAIALLFGVLRTGFAEEFLFRGLIAGSLARRMSVSWANFAQAGIFFVPHLFVLRIMPELWWILPIVFAGAMFKGWVRIKSGSMLGPWIIHASANVTTCLGVAIRSAS